MSVRVAAARFAINATPHAGCVVPVGLVMHGASRDCPRSINGRAFLSAQPLPAFMMKIHGRTLACCNASSRLPRPCHGGQPTHLTRLRPARSRSQEHLALKVITGNHRPFGRVIADRVTESARPSCPRTPAPACQHQGPPPWTSDASMARRSTAASGADVHDVHPGAGGGGADPQDRNALLESIGNLCTSAACRLHPRPVLRRVRAASG